MLIKKQRQKIKSLKNRKAIHEEENLDEKEERKKVGIRFGIFSIFLIN